MRAEQWREEEENDWILLDELDLEEEDKNKREKQQQSARVKNLAQIADGLSWLLLVSAKTRQKQQAERRRKQMALDANDVELIRASWLPARRDPSGAGVLLFKGLFTKFPDYLRFFSQFSDLDVESLQSNKRLIKHAVKVIDTVTFVVDSIGNETKTDQLNDALVNLVRSHLKRKIGLQEFRNLGIVLIDFICDLQQRRRSPSRQTNSPFEHSLESMVSSEADIQDDSHHHHNDYVTSNNQFSGYESASSSPPLLDTNQLVTAWTKLYSSILDLVKRESGDTTDDH